MPYILEERRQPLLDRDVTPETPGELNYVISLAFVQYIQDHGLSYATINDIVGACEGAKLEFYRRIAAPYEQTKVISNGDIYG